MAKKKSATDRLRDWEAERRERMAVRLMAKPEEKPLMATMRFPGVALIMGDHGSGKSGLAHFVMEEFHKRKSKTGALYLPPALAYLKPTMRKLLPKWVTVCTSLSQIPPNSVTIYDEAAQGAHSRRTQSSDAIELDSMVGISRQRNTLILFISHHSRKLDPNVVQECHRIVYKEPTWAHVLFERDEMFRFSQKALEYFETLPDGKRERARRCLVMDFQNLKFYSSKNKLPSYWSEALSVAFADGSEPKKKAKSKKEAKAK